MQYDAIIIGSGPAGTVAASVLSKSKRVLWLEDGRKEKSKSPFSHSTYVNDYKQAGQAFSLSRPPISIGLPSTVGGGLSINSGLVQRIDENSFSKWGTDFQSAWSWNRITKLYDQIEENITIDSSSLDSDLLGSRMIHASNRLNWKYKKIQRWDLKERFSFQNQVRNSIEEAGGLFLSSTRATRIMRLGNEWLVEVLQNSEVKMFKAKVVILAGGAVLSPQLLSYSKIISSVVPLKFHPVLKVAVEMADQWDNNLPHFSPIQIKEFAPDISIGASVSSRELLWVEHLKSKNCSVSRLRNWKKQILLYCSTSDSPDMRIYFSYLLNEPTFFSFKKQVTKEMLFGLSKLIEFSKAMMPEKIFCADRTFDKSSSLAESLNKIGVSVSAIHLFSSLPMSSDKRGVVDFSGRIRGQEGLYCIDSSILPSSPGVNPQLTVMAIAKGICEEISSL